MKFLFRSSYSLESIGTSKQLQPTQSLKTCNAAICMQAWHWPRKKAIRQDGLLLNLMPGSLWRASCPPPSGPLLRNVQIRSRRICPTQESVHRQTTDKTKGPVFRLSLSFYLSVTIKLRGGLKASPFIRLF